MRKIGYLGPKGTFSYEALQKYIKGKERYEACDYSTIADVILAAENEEVSEAIVPIENSLEGAINVTLDMLASEANLKIKDEFVLSVEANLLVKKGKTFKDIKYILSHPQPIGQCRKYINFNFPEAAVKSVSSTSLAAMEVAGGSGDSAVIGSMYLADMYDLDILAKSIQDGENNRTRFVIVGKEDGVMTGSDKTSIVFSTEDQPGSLYRVLDIFNLWDINMTRIESRPAKNQLGRYIFFVDLNGHKDNEDVKAALTMVKRKTSFFKFLGSYPIYNY